MSPSRMTKIVARRGGGGGDGVAAVVGPAGLSHLAAVPASAEEFREVVAVCLCFVLFCFKSCR